MKKTKRQHQTKENSQLSIQSFHVPVQAACITTVIPTVDCSTHRLTYSMLDAVPPIHAESSHVATDKVPSK